MIMEKSLFYSTAPDDCDDSQMRENESGTFVLSIPFPGVLHNRSHLTESHLTKHHEGTISIRKERRNLRIMASIVISFDFNS